MLGSVSGFGFEPGGSLCIERRHALRLLTGVEWPLRSPLSEGFQFGAKVHSRTDKTLRQLAR
jgi:hypothetical protein